MSIIDKISLYLNPKNDVEDTGEIQYSTKKTTDMTEEELQECSVLFSSSYGKYSGESTIRPGEQIKMSVSYYHNNYCKSNFYVARAKLNGNLVGHAFYLRKDYSEQGFGIMTWVLQLVVDSNYRRRGIASTLLRSIWGFSDDYAWGLATTNPCTVKTLESATFRKCKPEIINKHLRAIRAIGADISFVKDASFAVTGSSSQINTQFFVDNHDFSDDDGCEKQLGRLRSGYEWLAFTFRDQGIQGDSYQKHFADMVAFSEKQLNEAYSRMNMTVHSWAKGTVNEVNFIQQYGNNGSILDLGCGQGRHAIELAKRGCRVTAVDFSKKNVYVAGENAKSAQLDNLMCKFVCDDVRTYRDNEKYDKVICLYDVIGSFPEKDDNLKIITTAYEHLKMGGVFILSVMNMELTETLLLEANKGNLQNTPDIIRKLPPSRIMQSSGDIFNPNFLAADTETGLIFRKEQFSDDDGLSAEYVIRDKRYTMSEIVGMLEEQGFEIEDTRYVRAGHFDDPLKYDNKHAKEICVIAYKR